MVLVGNFAAPVGRQVWLSKDRISSRRFGELKFMKYLVRSSTSIHSALVRAEQRLRAAHHESKRTLVHDSLSAIPLSLTSSRLSQHPSSTFLTLSHGTPRTSSPYGPGLLVVGLKTRPNPCQSDTGDIPASCSTKEK